jgi:transcriptional regulator with XRE-family HTH domain
MTRHQLGAELAIIRRDHQLSQADLAKLTHIHPGAISHFECGDRYPSLPNLISLAIALDIDLNHLLKLPTLGERSDLLILDDPEEELPANPGRDKVLIESFCSKLLSTPPGPGDFLSGRVITVGDYNLGGASKPTTSHKPQSWGDRS